MTPHAETLRQQLDRLENKVNRLLNFTMWTLLLSAGILGKLWGFPEVFWR
jgi:hypothetical protein